MASAVFDRGAAAQKGSLWSIQIFVCANLWLSQMLVQSPPNPCLLKHNQKHVIIWSVQSVIFLLRFVKHLEDEECVLIFMDSRLDLASQKSKKNQ